MTSPLSSTSEREFSPFWGQTTTGGGVMQASDKEIEGVAKWLAFRDAPCKMRTAEDRWGLLSDVGRKDYLRIAADCLRFAKDREPPADPPLVTAPYEIDNRRADKALKRHYANRQERWWPW